MKVVLLQDVPGVGMACEVKNVSPGYARNFLFPNKLAKHATPAAMQELEALKRKLAKEEAELVRYLEELARRFKETSLAFQLRTDAAGSVFGSVTKEMILKAVRENHLVTKERVEVELARPIKEFGEHTVPIKFKKGIASELKVIVRPLE